MKKTLSFLLAFLMIVTMVPVVAITSFASTDPMEIGSKEDFLKIGDAAGNYVLTQDIDLDGMVINTYAVLLKAGTTIDGAGHSIHNYSVKFNSENQYKPQEGAGTVAMSLFGLGQTTEATYTIKNLTVGTATDAIDVDSAIWGAAASPLVGVVPSGTTLNVTNVTSYANFTNANSNGGKTAGAIVAYAYGDLAINGCVVHGTVLCNSSNDLGVGGILGLVGANTAVTVQNCANYATVTGVNRIGGIIGSVGGANTESTISNCVNYGTVNSTGTSVGGVIGHIWGAGTATTISNSVNYGTVKSTNGSGDAAAFIGCAESGATFTVENCKNYAPVTTGSGGTAAAFIGSAKAANATFNVTNFENHGAITGKYAAAGIANMDANASTLYVTNLFNTAKLDGSPSRAAVVVAKNEPATVSTLLNIDGVVNLGDVAGKWKSGALVGSSKATKITVTNSYMVGKIEVTGQPGMIDPMVGRYDLPDTSAAVAGSTGNYHNQDLILDNGTNVTSSTAKTVAELLEMLNANETITNAYGVFKYKTDAKNALVQATPAIKGIQFGKVSGEGENATYSARLVATIQDTLYYENIGFKITVGEGNAKIHYSANVYGTIYGNDNGLITYTAQELGGKYVYGLVINGIPAGQEVTLTVQTYAKDADGEYLGAAQTITIQNGALVENAQ